MPSFPLVWLPRGCRARCCARSTAVPCWRTFMKPRARCSALDDVIVATDSDEVADLCRGHGWHFRMTSPSHRSGTDRVHEVSEHVAADVYVNLQGDEPLARREQLDTLLDADGKRRCAGRNAEDAMRAGRPRQSQCREGRDQPGRTGAVLLACDHSLRSRRRAAECSYYKHLGFYAYRKPALDAFVKWPESALERSERLEQLRFLDNGVNIYVAETPFDTVGVDTEEDLRRVEGILRKRRA